MRLVTIFVSLCIALHLSADCADLTLAIDPGSSIVLPLSRFAAPPVTNTASVLTVARRWTADDGLPQTYVQCMLQARSGYLWVGTFTGLARFDGKDFTNFTRSNNPELRSHNILALAEDAEGSLWVGTADGLYRFKEGRFDVFTTADGLSANWIRALCSTADGRLWIASDEGVEVYREGAFQNVASVGKNGFTAVTDLCDDRKGNVWVAAATLFRIDYTQLSSGEAVRCEEVPHGVALPIGNVASGLSGEIWFTSPAGIFRWKDNQVADFTPPEHPTLGKVSYDLESDAKGRVLVGYVGGFIRITPGEATSLDVRQPAPARILCDRLGNVWTGGRSGLFLYPNRPVTSLPLGETEPDWDIWNVLAASNGDVWIGGARNLWRWRSGTLASYQFASFGLHGRPDIRALWESDLGEIWAGIGGFLCHLHDPVDGAFQNLRIYHLGSPISSISTASAGLPFVYAFNEIAPQNGILTNIGAAKGLPDGEYFGCLRTRSGDLWYGRNRGGLLRVRHQVQTSFTVKDGLPSDTGAAVLEDEFGAIWILTDRGLSRYKSGHFSSIGTGGGLPDDILLAMLDDQLGNYWFNSHAGIFRVPKAELNRALDSDKPGVEPVRYGIQDGLPSMEGNAAGFPNSCRTLDGRLWFPTTRGVAIVDPVAALASDLPAPVALERVLVNGRDVLKAPLLTRSVAPLKIQPGEGRGIAFHFCAIEMNGGKRAAFRYRLRGHSPDWMEAGPQRFAIFPGLRPGAYEFEVLARSRRGVWNATPASFSFVLVPFVHETLWFRGGIPFIIVASATGVVIYRFRVQRRILQLEQASALARERERIARDIHDDLGATLTKIALLSDMPDVSSTTPPEQSRLERIAQLAGSTVDSIGELIWASNPSFDTAEGLAAYLRQYASRFFEHTAVDLQFRVNGGSPSIAIGAEIRRAIFLVFKEALNNIQKHAAASAVQVELVFEPGVVTLLLRDNGHGFDPQDTRPFRYGLKNMRDRVAALHGKFQLRSSLGAGAEITISLPFDLQPRRRQNADRGCTTGQSHSG